MANGIIKQFVSPCILSELELCEIERRIDIKKEVWRDIRILNNEYQVSNFGRIKSLPKVCQGRFGLRNRKERIIKPFLFKGYFKVCITRNKKNNTYYIHRLIADAFIPNPLNKPQINHINGIKHDNSIENLEWVTDSENKYHAHSLSLNPYTGFNDMACIQFSIEGKKIKEYNSITEAMRETGISNHISCCLRGTRKTAGGFKWKYKV